ncbi:uncharacterized protein [Chiloscyllium punctatum]|uniref:uncharacterized protein n=1 Tax=Chiloscyllium punctatum TaxID=137246 RepID=UPI003B63A396
MRRTCPMLLVLSFLIGINAHQSTQEERNAVQNSLSTDNISGSVQSWPMKRRFRRDDSCPSGSPSNCSKCKAGTYLARCTCNCVECREGEFTDSENHLPECRRCLQCQANDGKKTKTNCTITHDTVCSCLENFYSTTNGNECRKCAECNAETDEVEQPCTETQDTVCRKKVHSSVNPAAIVIPIFLVLGAIAGIVGYLCIKKKYCRRNKLPSSQILEVKNGKEMSEQLEVPGTVCSPLICTETFVRAFGSPLVNRKFSRSGSICGETSRVNLRTFVCGHCAYRGAFANDSDGSGTENIPSTWDKLRAN